MHVVIAPDSFKGTLTAAEAAGIISAEAQRALGQDALITRRPVADGGEGTAEIIAGDAASSVAVPTVDPLGRPTSASISVHAEGRAAALDIAAASGLGLVSPAKRDPLTATTSGTGILIRAALDFGCETIIIGLGGSATVDGGTGLLSELGVKFLDGQGTPVVPRGSDLDRVVRIDLTGLDERLSHTTIIAACDVANVLLGDQGAAAVFGPQKGADAHAVRVLERRLGRLAAAYAEACGRNVADIAGSGAAGGTGAALASIGAKLRPGADVVLEAVSFDRLLDTATLVVTGEGRLDRQTPGGKAVAGVARWCQAAGVPVIAIAGSVDPGVDLARLGLLAAFSTGGSRDPSSAADDLGHCARQVFNLLTWAKPGEVLR